jgi:hypothetical protein
MIFFEQLCLQFHRIPIMNLLYDCHGKIVVINIKALGYFEWLGITIKDIIVRNTWGHCEDTNLY